MATRANNTAQNSFDFDRAAFDLKEGERLKEEGMERASLSRKQLLGVARECAVRVARRAGGVTSDDVFREMLRDGYDPAALGQAAGSVFRGGELVFHDEWEKSERVSNHARMNRVWRLKDSSAAQMPRKDVASVSVEQRRQAS